MTDCEHACTAWSILVCAARERRLYTYGELKSIIGCSRIEKGMSYILEPIAEYCKRQPDMPKLTVLVVNKRTGLPGDGLGIKTCEEFIAEMWKVYNFKWLERVPPTLFELEDAKAMARRER